MRYLYLSILLIISGILSNFLESNISIFAPGVIFGLIFGIFLYFTEKISLIKIIFFVLLSWGAYFLAWTTAFSLYMVAPIGSIGFPVAGIVGSMLLVFTTSIIKRINFSKLILVVVTGGFTANLFTLSILTDLRYLPGFIVWQLSVGLLLYRFIETKKVLNINLS